MKRITISLKTAFLSMIFSAFAVTATYAQSAEKKEENSKETNIENLINSKNFVFKAQTVLPLGSRVRQLTSEYDMRVLGDSIVTYLPYFGRAYVAPINPSEGGIQFTSTDYDYKVQEKKKGWNVTIVPKDTRDVRELVLSVTKSGNASLMVSSNNRQSISFNGYIASRR